MTTIPRAGAEYHSDRTSDRADPDRRVELDSDGDHERAAVHRLHGPGRLVDNVLRPLVMARGLTTPMPIILIGVIGGTIAFGISGLFLGPIVLSVAWVLLLAWVREGDAVAPPA